jgi:histidinol-phosphatase (PHP family)
MYFTDYHSHSERSPDSHTPLLENVNAALTAGLSELCITDHFDLVDSDGTRRYAAQMDWADRLADVHAVRAAVGDRLRLKLGLELGSGQVDAADSASILALPELDFAIGSIHNLSLAAGGTDLYYINYSSPALCYEVLDDYFTSMESLVETDCYDVLGHILYPIRYMRTRDGQDVDIYRYLDRMHTFLKKAALHGKGIELNTWCGRMLEIWRPILEVFQACGGEFVTVGSDAHTAGDIGRGVSEAYELLRQTGFRYLTSYDKRTPVQIKL